MPRVRRCLYDSCHGYAYNPNHYCDEHIEHEQEYQAERNKYRRDKTTTYHYNHVTRYRTPVKAKQNKFYHSKEWKALRSVVLTRDYNLCQYCMMNAGNIVDHILPIEAFPKGMEEVNNLVTCCKLCHAKKTRWEEQYYGTGQHNSRTNNAPVTEVNKINKLMNSLNRQYKAV